MNIKHKYKINFITAILVLSGNVAAQNPIEACQTTPSSMTSNIQSWNDIAANGKSIIEQIDELASNVNGILKIEADLKKMDGDLKNSKKVFDMFIPVVTPVSSVKNVFKLASNTLGTIRSNGVSPAKDTATKIATESGIRELQRQLDENVKPQIQETIRIAEQNAAELTEKLSLLETTCSVIAAASCAVNQPLDEISNATKPAPSVVNSATTAQNEYLNLGQQLNSSLKKANNTLAFTDDFSKQIKDIQGPLKDITGGVNKLGGIMEQKIKIKAGPFNESFKLKTAFKEAGKIVKKLKKIPGVKQAENIVNEPIEAVMNEVTKPIEKSLKPLTKGLKLPSVDFNALNIGSVPNFDPNGLPNPADITSPLQPLLTACAP